MSRDAWFNFLGQFLAGITLASIMWLLAWWRGDTVPLWATFLGFVIGDLLWWRQRNRSSTGATK